jgi:hypothetical protein
VVVSNVTEDAGVQDTLIIETHVLNSDSAWIVFLLVGIGTLCGAMVMLLCLRGCCTNHFRDNLLESPSKGAPLRPGQMYEGDPELGGSAVDTELE